MSPSEIRSRAVAPDARYKALRMLECPAFDPQTVFLVIVTLLNYRQPRACIANV